MSFSAQEDARWDASYNAHLSNGSPKYENKSVTLMWAGTSEEPQTLVRLIKDRRRHGAAPNAVAQAVAASHEMPLTVRQREGSSSSGMTTAE